jgi:osmoprotectant transport system permease protein
VHYGYSAINGEMNQIIQFLLDPHNNLPGETLAFLRLCLLPMLVAVVVGVLVGMLVYKYKIAAFFAVNASEMIRAVPFLAVLFLFVPIFHVGYTPAAIALTLLGIPPVLLNTVTGLSGVSPVAMEAARGMGMSQWQVVTRIQVPLALPLVTAGVRIAAVQIVATAPLGGLIGAGGYGNYIIDGVNTLNTTEILAGSLLVALMALLFGMILAWIENRLTPIGIKQLSAKRSGNSSGYYLG